MLDEPKPPRPLAEVVPAADFARWCKKKMIPPKIRIKTQNQIQRWRFLVDGDFCGWFGDAADTCGDVESGIFNSIQFGFHRL
jgi:hypothetical protein